MPTDELAFYDALANNESAKDMLGDYVLLKLVRVLVERVKANASIDWTVKELVRKKLKVVVKRTLRQYGHPPDMQKTGYGDGVAADGYAGGVLELNVYIVY